MSESNVIKEFLVAIGWKNDEAGAQKVTESIAGMTKLTLGLGAALESMAATAMFAAQRIAMSYANLQTESRNVGASAENIKTYTYAVSQLGGTVEEALGSIQSFARKLQESPGQVAWLESFIGKARDAKGQLLDTTELIDKFVHSQKFQRAEEWQKRKFAENAGIDLNTWKALNDPKARDFLEESRRVNQNYGLDPDKLAKQGREFTNEWQAIWLRIRAIRDRFLMGLGFEDSLKKFKDYLDQNKDQINQNLEAFVERVKPLVKAFGEVAGKIIEVAGTIVKYLGPDTTAWIATAALLNHFTGMGTAVGLLATRLIPALGASLAGLMVGPSGTALKAIAGIAAFAGLMSYFNLDTSPDALRRGHKNENWTGHKHDDDSDPESSYGSSAERMRRGEAPPAKKKSRWERTKEWLGEKIGIKAQARETVEGQKGGETPAVARGQRLSDDQKAEMAAGIRKAAKNLGIQPEQLAAIISFETAGTMDPWKKGPTTKWGTHRGLIQWGEPQAREYGVSRNSSITQQLEAVERYLRKRGVKPRMSTEQIYGAVLAGGTSDEHLDRQDKFGTTPRSGARRMWNSAHRHALAALEERLHKQENAARRMADARRAARRPEVEPQTPVHIPERRRTREDERWDNRPRYDRSRPGAPLVTPRARHDGGTGIARPGGVSPRTPIGHVSHSNSVRHGDMNAKTTINVSTPGDPGAAARAIAGIQNNVNADLVRNMRGAAR